MSSDIFQKLESLGIDPIRGDGERFSAQREDLELFQQLFGFPLPYMYFECVLRYGLSGFNHWVTFPVPISWNEKTDESPNDVRVFYGINKDDLYAKPGLWDLRYETASIRSNGLPDYFLPFCESDGLATVVYISCREQDYGHIYALTRTQIWDIMERTILSEQISEAAFHIADSFEKFIEDLTITEM